MSGGSGGRHSATIWQDSAATQQNYRPLNVRDALSYLDQVKIQFMDQPEVYNRFLDVMKEFKGQIIDTPGVIDRVSTLFRGHPSLISGFNTFLPPGYRIDCIEGDQGLITVTTPSGTISNIAGQFATTIIDLQAREGSAAASPLESTLVRGATTARTIPSVPILTSGPAPAAPLRSAAVSNLSQLSAPASIALPPRPVQPAAPSGPSTPSAAHFLASGMTSVPPNSSSANQAISARPPGKMVEFNHAIGFVNKIKNRFNGDPETYKMFLEILQTYQRDGKDIFEVYDEVTALFHGAPDLIDEFKQFLPEQGAPFGSGNFGMLQAAAVPEKKRTAKEQKEGGSTKKRRNAAEPKGSGHRKKVTHKDNSPSGDEGEGLALAPGAPQTLASPEEVAFFDKVKKYIDDRTSYHEFLKLLNLFTQDMIDVRTLVARAELFIGQSGDAWASFKKMVNFDESVGNTTHPTSAQNGYGFGGMINVDTQVVENTPMLERVKPDLSGSKVKSYGPSYRKLPTSEVNISCTGRDAMCWQVLNDEWVSHPTWAAEDAAPFMTHKKNLYEEALHKSEEERHEYDYHIEANLRTISLLEPLWNKIQTMDNEERSHFNLKAGLGGQSKSIYQRIIKKVYGKELGPDIIRALHDNPVIALPIVLERLKAKDEEWKRAQREWNRVWREQDAKNFYKALDHQGVQFKANDKKTLAAKSLIAEAEARCRDQTNLRFMTLDRSVVLTKPQFAFDFKDIEVLKDVLKLVISYLDRISNALSAADKDRIEWQLRDFVPLLFMFDKEDFDADFGDAEHGTSEGQSGSDESDGDVSMAEDDETTSGALAKRGKKGPGAADLRKRLLKQVGERDGRDKRGSTMTPGPEGDITMDGQDRVSAEGTPATDGDRGETPVPIPADPEAVAEAVEKDKAVADASEQTWVQVDTPEASRPGSEVSGDGSERRVRPTRKGNFFANNHFYVLLRLLQILYSRLLNCKTIADQLSVEKKQPINPTAVRLGLAEPDTQFQGIEAGENPAQHYYTHLLSIAERLFENEVDVTTYEETLRLMFGTKAYTMFTLDRVVAAIVKQTQTILGDMKSQELLALLRRDRTAEKSTTRQQIAYRMQAESVLAGEDSIYKVEYQPATDVLTVQLLGREDLTVDDAVTAQEKWQQYIDSYVLTFPTEGLPHRVDVPFMKRNLGENTPDSTAGDFVADSGLNIKIALGNYKMFYTSKTEDYFHRRRTPAAVVELDLKEQAKEEGAVKWWKDFVG